MVTDAFPKPAAATFHANFAPSLGAVKPSSQPLWYVVRGPAAAGQLAVLGSEPGESDYSPLWRTVVVRWQPGVAPKLLTSDDMINALARKGRLTVTRHVHARERPGRGQAVAAAGNGRTAWVDCCGVATHAGAWSLTARWRRRRRRARPLPR